MDRATVYRIRVQGRLAPRWSGWFEGLEVAAAADDLTVISGLVPDQAALHGVLARIRDLGLELVSVEAVAADGPSQSKSEV